MVPHVSYSGLLIDLIHALFNATATTEIYTYSHTLSLHDALPICAPAAPAGRARPRRRRGIRAPAAPRGRAIRTGARPPAPANRPRSIHPPSAAPGAT